MKNCIQLIAVRGTISDLRFIPMCTDCTYQPIKSVYVLSLSLLSGALGKLSRGEKCPMFGSLGFGKFALELENFFCFNLWIL